MRVFKPLLTAAALAVLAAPSLAVLAAPTAASADPAWGWRDHDDWRAHEWRGHAWREEAWRRHEWREHRPWAYESAYRPGWNEYRRAWDGQVIVIHHAY